VRERGVQSRRVRPGSVEPQRRPDPPPRSGTNVWQVIAIVALLAATAGWTTVAVIALRPTTVTAVAPSASVDPNADDASIPPDSHDAPELEALLPTELSGTPLAAQSYNGDHWLSMDPALATFLSSPGRTTLDLSVAQTGDPTGALAGFINLYKVTGAEPTAVRDALLAAWKGDNSDIKVSTVTIGGQEVTKADFGPDYPLSFLYLHDGAVYDIETNDVAFATAALAAIGKPGASSGPATSAAPPASASPAP